MLPALLIYITSCTDHKLNCSRNFVVEKYNYANMYSDTVAYNLVRRQFKTSNFCAKFNVNNLKLFEVAREN